VALAAFRIPVKKLQALPRKLVRLLEHVAAFDNLLNLQPASDALSNVLEVEFLQLETPASGSRPAEVRPLPRDPQGQLQIQAGRNLAIALHNKALTPVHVYVTVFDERQCSVGLVYPYQPDFPTRLRPSESVLVGSGPRYLLQMQLPEGAETAVDRFKIWVSTTGMQPGIMAMPPLGQRLEPPLRILTDRDPGWIGKFGWPSWARRAARPCRLLRRIPGGVWNKLSKLWLKLMLLGAFQTSRR
jgi:hypothetical protein